MPDDTLVPPSPLDAQASQRAGARVWSYLRLGELQSLAAAGKSVTLRLGGRAGAVVAVGFDGVDYELLGALGRRERWPAARLETAFVHGGQQALS